MKLQTKQLKQFKAAASGIRGNNLLPIYAYLRIHNGRIIKTTGESFVSMDIDCDGSVLLDERLLMSLVDATTSEELTVTVVGVTATITDGKIKKTCPTEIVSNFPEPLTPTSEPVELISSILSEIRTASAFTDVDDTMPFKRCVFIGRGLIAASNGFISYTKKVVDLYPEMILRKSATDIIIKLPSVIFTENETYQFFTSGSLQYGFIKTDLKFVSMIPFANVPDGQSVSINKSELIAFCEMCINDCTGRIVIVSIESGFITMVDSAYELNISQPLSASLPNFSFNPVFMNRLLKSIPDEIISVVNVPARFYITGGSEFVSLIMECQKLLN